MKSTLKILKNNIFTIVVIVVFIIGMFALSYLKKMYWDNNDEAIYGDRVDGIENYEIDKDEKEKIIENIKSDSDILEVVFDIEGRTINLTLTVIPELLVSDAKVMGKEILAYFSSEDLSYYSININFVKEDKSLDNFPISGYKHYSNKDISWTKDREVTGNEN